MPTLIGSVRRLLLTPQLAEVTFAKRGFPAVPSGQTQRLEAVPQAVICGFEWGIDSRDQWEVERRLAMVDDELRGFACEGVTMAFTILDAMGRGHRARDLLLGPARQHIFLAYIGMGFAMARLPRRLWNKVVPDLTGDPYYPVMSWLAVDGYGFDRAYFDTRRWVDGQHVPKPYRWDGSPDYFTRAVDQGIGRALWFICGGQTPLVASAVSAFATHRQADLWSGVGLAAAFAGGSDNEALASLRRACGEHAAELAVGAIFAAKARSYSGTVPAQTELAASEFVGLSVQGAVALADDTAVAHADGGPAPAYELWRQNIRARVADLVPSGLSARPPQPRPCELIGTVVTESHELFADLAAEGEALDHLVTGLDPVQWDLPTPAPGWTIRHQIAHLASTARIAFTAATSPAAVEAQIAVAARDFDAALQAALTPYLAEPPQALLTRWRAEREAAVEALAAVPPGRLLPWLSRPMPASLLASAGIMELFAHGQDIADAIGADRVHTDRIRHLVRFAEGNRDFGYQVRGLTPPDHGFRLDLTAPSGAVWRSGPPDSPERITGPAVDFCLLVTRRRHRDDLALVALGAEADRWLDIAQAYRGAPGPGRAPGQFRRAA
jgi:enediyne biosynthesis protein E2